MAIPTNSGKAKDMGCKPVSSNCVVWQGPDLDCIGVCRGDTISDVTAKIAVEVCTLIEMFDLEQFDLGCLTLAPEENPEKFNELIQILIQRICALENIDPEEVESTDCPDSCLVDIAECFQYNTQQGDPVTQMTLVDYARAIGELLCSTIADQGVISGGLDSVEEEQTLQAARITKVEDEKVDTNALNYQVSSKTDPSAGLQFIPDALRYVENSLIGTQEALGSPSQIYSNMLKAGDITNEEKVSSKGAMSTITGWTNSPENLAQSEGNAWLAIRDLREAVDYIQSNFISNSCTDLNFILRASITTVGDPIITVFADASTGFTTNWVECDTTTTFIIEDAKGNLTTFKTSALDLIANPAGYPVNISGTTIDPSLDITVTAQTCFSNEVSCVQCEKDVSYVISAQTICPALTLTITSSSVQYQFTTTPGYSYVANVYYASGTMPVATQIIGATGVSVSSIITGLLEGTDYEIALTIKDTAGDETECARVPFTTLENLCTPPSGVSAVLTT